jgi:hypothetical protein
MMFEIPKPVLRIGGLVAKPARWTREAISRPFMPGFYLLNAE